MQDPELDDPLRRLPPAREAAVEQALVGQDAVIDAIGGTTPYKDTGLETSTARTLLAAMERTGVRRLVVVSAMGVEGSRENAPFWYEHLLMPTMLRGVVKDKTGMEGEVRASDLDFVIVRPALLSDAEDAPPLRVPTGEAHGRSTAGARSARTWRASWSSSSEAMRTCVALSLW